MSSMLRPGHGGSGASCSLRTAAPAAAHAAGRHGRRLLEAAECSPWEVGEREHGRLRHRTLAESGSGAIAIASTSTSVRVWSASMFRNTCTDARRRALAIGDDDLDLLHVAIAG